ncbi:MAG: DEAD/DEAH box helicase family protein [Chloroflexi bacterium]|nr:DEAD/DEAH box helicase family protein [Chloroflexota bacterium]
MTLNEADTRSKLIDPALHARGWTEGHIKREETTGAITVVSGKARKAPRGRTDYTLRVKVNIGTQPVAVALIEAKSEALPPAHGLEQAKMYAAARRLNVPFVFSSNGHQFVEYDNTTGLTTRPRPMADFPTPDDLRTRYEAAVGFTLDDPVARPLLTSYLRGEASRRYYQDAAIRAVFEKVARAERRGEPKRALLSLATGAGKTFIAVNLLRRLADAGQLRRALFVCDRDELRAQASAAFQLLFGTDAAPVSAANPQKNARVLVATYQTLDIASEDAEATFLAHHYKPDYFSHIVIDECHRSAWGKWSEVLTRNPNAVQIGLTATPRRLDVTEDTPEARADAQITADNIRHFGEPVYEYDIGQGIEDGYLAACEIVEGRADLDDTGITIEQIVALGAKDARTGEPLTVAELRDLYQRTDYEDRILLPDRVQAMCADLFRYLLETGGPEQKSIIFCVRDQHADDVAIAMNNLYAQWCTATGRPRLDNYAFKCTAASGGGDMMPDFKGGSRHHFVATTVDLLTTGVDVPAVRNVVFFRYLKSPIAFYQMLGRGTRLDAQTGKLMFRVYDYTKATRLFGEAFVTTVAPKPKAGPTTPGDDDDPSDEPREPTIVVEGFDVQVTEAGRSIVTTVDGRAMPVSLETYRQMLAERLLADAGTLDDFRAAWVDPSRRRELLQGLPDGERSALVVRSLSEMGEYDLYDVLADLGYGALPRTRAERADSFTYKHAGWLAGMPASTADAVRALAGQFARGGTEELERRQVFRTPALMRAGGLAALSQLGEPSTVLRETKERMFAT